jgi:SAM-dependent methyltransferase
MTTDGRAQAAGGAGDDEAAALFARRASSFGTAAAEYAAHRPGYPARGVAWALAPAGSGPLHVLDLAAGTGKLSQAVVALGHRVTAVEPDGAMLAELRGHLPGAEALGGTAEEIPLPDASVDAVVVGQALHWFDQDRALPEIARVLRPGGPFASLANADDDRVPWVAELDRAALSPVHRSGWQDDPPRVVQPHPAFAPAEVRDFANVQRRTADSLVATVATHSHMLVMEPAARERVIAGMRAFLAAHPVTSAGEFDLPLVTRVQRCTRVTDRPAPGR